MTTLYLSKYALTDGIKKVEVEYYESRKTDYIHPNGYYNYYKLGVDLHETKEAALAKAEEMRKKAIEAAKKKLAKLEKMTVKIEGE